MFNNYAEFLVDWREHCAGVVAIECFQTNREVVQADTETLYKKVVDVAALIKEMGLKGQHIGIVSENSCFYYAYYFAIVSTGNVAVLCPVDADADEMKKLLDFTDTKILFVSDKSKLGRIDGINTITMTSEIGDVQVNAEELFDFDAKETDLACMIFTSGTTGERKAVCLSQKNCLFRVNLTIDKPMQGGKLFYTNPFEHVGLVASVAVLYSKMTMLICEHPRLFFAAARKMNPAQISVVPSFLKTIQKKLKVSDDIKEVLGSSVQFLSVAGAALPKELITYFRGYGVFVGNNYGMSESTGYATTVCVDGRGSVGQIAEGEDIEIIDGEVVLSGDNIMMGYYHNPEETQKTIKDGKLYTGDLGYFDEEGYLYITGRKKNLIILSNGENISPEEIESKLEKIDEIDEAVVKECDDRLMLCAVPVQDTDECKKAISEKVDEYNRTAPLSKRIMKISFVDELPKTSNGKIKR
jgi:long-chain acyl-CoA synthetase